MTATWRLLLLATAAAVASTMADNLSEAALSCGAFVSSPTAPSSQFCKRGHNRQLPLATTLQSLSTSLAMSKSSNQSLQQKILEGAALKLLQKDSSGASTPPPNQAKPMTRETNSIPEGQFSYYIREGQRSEINAITDVLMNSFQPDSQPSFDSYIRRYKYNHLQMFFDAIEEDDRGLFVACAVPASPSSMKEEEQIVGFCSVDGRAPDPSCKIEFLTPSTLAGTSPRPYLSDLGVSKLHRRRGLGEKLVLACEQWTCKRGYEKLHLKVERKNVGAFELYAALGYKKTKLPWGKEVGNVGSRWDTTVLLEKSVKDSMQGEKRKRTW
eukprot:CAMPEP_0172323188 /NCGR_PEP_ID=MMETSP1058-20130122/48096_1 /TAXON_ID=83371 /ORGANISM="Detonula confervacea, Strain CCMP 353" /LENGTH=325 /DNA_ID=CAMNT_0013039129 /DNA_START=29 /DNA_END=1003 /DNA_ORIENTATION=+